MEKIQAAAQPAAAQQKTIRQTSKKESTFVRSLRTDGALFVMLIPVIAFYLIFCYGPMYGAVIAFKDYKPNLGILGSPWVGMKHFKDFFSSYYFGTILRNTLVISVSSLVVGFPIPIVLALLLNELKNKAFARVVQTISYMPHFISLVVVCSLIRSFTSDTGLITYFWSAITGEERLSMLQDPAKFVPIYVLSGVWQEVGWSSIIYIAALAGVDQELYEAAKIDGAGKMRQMWHITLPGILPTVIIMLILRMGQLLSVGFEKIILLYNPAIYDTAEVISTFVYRRGLLEANWSYSAAVGLFNSAVNIVLLTAANWLSRRVTEQSLW